MSAFVPIVRRRALLESGHDLFEGSAYEIEILMEPASDQSVQVREAVEYRFSTNYRQGIGNAVSTK